MIHLGDLFTVLPTLEAESVDACVTDPPYELTANKRGGSGAASLNLDSPAGRSRITTGGGFMGKEWDGTGVAFDPAAWRLVLRVLKPGAHLVAFGGTRTFHRMTTAIEDAGFEIRDCLSWLYGSGFPKSLNLPGGLGTALKPSWEPVILARNPLCGRVAYNVGTFGTGALNIEACRIGDDDTRRVKEGGRGQFPHEDDSWTPKTVEVGSDSGRWPANVLLDEHAAEALDEQTGVLHSGDAHVLRRGGTTGRGMGYGSSAAGDVSGVTYGDSGGASRFYYVAKPSREERDMGCHDLAPRQRDESRKDGNPGGDNPRNRGLQPRGNHHPTVKPVELMRWLVKLVTPPGGIVLDPFTGSGTTGMACRYEQRQFIGIEREAEYVAIAERRIGAVAPLFGEAPSVSHVVADDQSR